VEIGLTGIKKEGRRIIFQNAGEEVTVKISGSRTTVKIDGAEGKRKNLVVGMNCTVTYAKDGDREATLVDCAK
jgi:transcription elongation GreA/GreB family factor